MWHFDRVHFHSSSLGWSEKWSWSVFPRPHSCQHELREEKCPEDEGKEADVHAR